MTSALESPRPSAPDPDDLGRPDALRSPALSRRRRAKPQASLIAHGEPMIWITGGALGLALVMILGLLLWVLLNGVGTFWPGRLHRIENLNGQVSLGEVTRVDHFAPTPQLLESLSPEARAAAQNELTENDGLLRRQLVRIGNYELTGEHFRWVSDYEIKPGGQSFPRWSILVERMEWGRFYGEPAALKLDGQVVAQGAEQTWAKFQELHRPSRDRWQEQRDLETHEIGAINAREERARLAVRAAELDHGKDSTEHRLAIEQFQRVSEAVNSDFGRVRSQIDKLKAENDRYRMVMTTGDGKTQELMLADIVRAFPANQLGFFGKIGVYGSRWSEFLRGEPREANSEGGIYPAIFGTVMMTLIMSLAVVPFGVLAALYLREYAKAGPMISAVRIAINNLAGVPSIVFGVFGLGFFCYLMGAGIDTLFFEAKLPNPTFGKGGIIWASLTLALLTLPVVIVATEEALSAVPNSMREGSYACGASKWQTIKRIVLPRAMPGIMTGMILAMARGAGEVAPLMLVGAVKLAPELPFDSAWPFLHLERSFMHMGFHIYDLSLQSQNSEAAKPMVYTTTLLLILIVAMMNLAAIGLRTRLRRKFVANQF